MRIMYAMINGYHQRKLYEAMVRMEAIRGRRWKCGPWTWRT